MCGAPGDIVEPSHVSDDSGGYDRAGERPHVRTADDVARCRSNVQRFDGAFAAGAGAFAAHPLGPGAQGRACFSSANCYRCEACVRVASDDSAGSCARIVGCY